jgi:hypothetical protein
MLVAGGRQRALFNRFSTLKLPNRLARLVLRKAGYLRDRSDAGVR